MRVLIIVLTLFVCFNTVAQIKWRNVRFSEQDSLRGSITPERVWWDLKKYDLYVSIDPEAKSISGKNTVSYKVLEQYNTMQIDLQEPMNIIKVEQEGKELKFDRNGNAFFIQLEAEQNVGEMKQLTIHYDGKPREAVRAPWDGGFSWKKDDNDNHFIATSNQGLGASVWWPCKDHMYDEPEDGLILSMNVPAGLVAVGNGRLEKKKKEKNKTVTYTWKVVNPINNYGVNVNIGDYVNIKSEYDGLNGTLDVDFWVLSYNKEKAEVHFEDAFRTLEAFEHWFGPYPFYEDSYKLVEVPYLGMEHQSSVTYGNGYQKGYRGRDLSGTGWGLKWDYIIIHETGHEWFANNITYKDAADMWVHEGFTSYSESLFTEYFYGKEAGAEYTRGLRVGISNREPIIGEYDVNKEGSGDMYSKGHNMLHTIRQIINDDEKWREILVGLNKDFYHETVTTKQIEDYISEKSGIDLSKVFEQYLRDVRIPVLEYAINEDGMYYRWVNCMRGFEMPIKATINGEETILEAKNQYQKFDGEVSNVEFDNNFYVYTFQIR